VSAYASPKRRTLEKIAPDVHPGAWRISALRDPITERRFRLFSIRSKPPLGFSTALTTHRCVAAHLIAPDHCPDVLSVTNENDRMDILTAWTEPAELEDLEGAELERLLQALLRTLLELERNFFFVDDLVPQALGKSGSGDWMILPPAYAFPARSGLRASSSERRGASYRDPAADEPYAWADHAKRRARHAALVGDLISNLVSMSPRRM